VGGGREPGNQVGVALPQNRHFVVSKDEWDTKEGPGNARRMHCIYSGIAKGTFWAEVTSSSKKSSL